MIGKSKPFYNFQNLEKQIGELAAPFIYKLIELSSKTLPYKYVVWMGDKIGILLYYANKEGREIVFKRINFIFGKKKSKNGIEKIVKTQFSDLIRSVFYGAIIPHLSSSMIKNIVVLKNKEYIERYMNKRGIIGVFAHFGEPWLMFTRLACEGYKVNILWGGPNRRLYTTTRDRIAKKWNINFILYKNHITSELQNLLDNNEFLMLSLDLDKPTNGIFVDFLGYPASTAVGPALLGLKTNSIFLPIFCIKSGKEKYKYEVITCSPIEPKKISGDMDQNVLENTCTLTKIIESFVEAHPELWNWFENRWKTAISKGMFKM